MINLGKNLHHAYCITGDKEKILSDLTKYLEKELKFPIQNNPDFLKKDYDSITVDDAREIGEAHKNIPISNKKIFVITTNFINEKAQNAMLKIFEEPRGDTHFFLLMPSADNLLPTLKSRLFIINDNSSRQGLDEENDAKDFLNSPIKKRLEIINKLTESIKNEEKSKIEIVEFLNSMELEISNSKSSERLRNFEIIEKMRQYVTDPSPSLKMILEYLALTIPVLKD